MNASIERVLQSDPNLPIDSFVEHLESDLFPAEMASAALADYIRQKYRGRRIDVVIAIADPALQFVLDHRDELFRGAPIVYSGVAVPNAGSANAIDGLTGVLRGVAYAETLKLALELHPSTEQVFVIGSSNDEQVVGSIRSELHEFSERIRLTYVAESTVPRLIDAVRAIPTGSLILYIFFDDEGSGTRRYEIDQIAQIVASAARVPVYGTNERYVGTGVVGGVVRGVRETGTRVGEIALQILRGARVGDMPIEDARLVPTFDSRQVRRWNIDLSRLPAGSDIRFRTPTVWESYKEYVAGTVIFVSAQMLLIAGLLAQRAKRRRAEQTIRAREATLRASYERIRQLAGTLISAQEGTRADIARDLHDGVCQDLAYLSIAIDRIKNAAGRVGDPQIQQALAKLQTDTLAASEGIRRLSHDLHPATLRLLGLAPALAAHCTEFQSRHRVRVAFRAEGDCRDLRPEVAVCLFRITQEALRNAVAHGGAQQLAVLVARHGEFFELAVSDDGRGFDVEAVRNGGGLGLVSIEERARVIGAEVQIVSGVGQGTTIRVRGPAEGVEPSVAP